MDYDYDQEEEYAPRVLWGRVAFALLGLGLAFFVGRCTAGGGASENDLAAERARVVELSSENTQLRQQLDAQQASQAEDTADTEQAEQDGGNGGDGGEEQEGTGETAEGQQDSTAEEGQTYTVRSGDTLTTIAEQFYGDASKYPLIAEANNLDSETGLRVNQELVIPPEE